MILLITLNEVIKFSNILFHDKNNGRFYRGDLNWDKKFLKKVNKAEITLTKEELTIKPNDKTLDLIVIPTTQIENFTFHTQPMGFRNQYCVKLKDNSKIFIFYPEGSKAILGHHLMKAFMENIIMPMGMKKAKVFMEGVKTVQKISNALLLKVSPQTKLNMLKCPGCKAPLEYMPPCKCEHCGVMIELEGFKISELFNCPDCTTLIPLDSKFCKECGKNLK